MVLCGLKDVRDYKIAAGGVDRLGTSIPFNIKADSIFFNNFTPEQVKSLYIQHTADTGQCFTPEALESAYTLTQGQPWLVNALAREIIVKMGITETIENLHMEEAARRLIVARETHLDSLVARLHEERVRKIIEPMILGDWKMLGLCISEAPTPKPLRN